MAETEDDFEWMRQLIRVGKIEESFKEQRKLLDKSGPWESGKGKGKDKDKKQEKERTKGKPATLKADGTEKYPIRFTQQDEAVKGISKETIASRMTKKTCLRCGKPNHSWRRCQSKEVVISATRLVPEKRKRTEAEDREGKKARIALTTRGSKENGERIFEEIATDEEEE